MKIIWLWDFLEIHLTIKEVSKRVSAATKTADET